MKPQPFDAGAVPLIGMTDVSVMRGEALILDKLSLQIDAGRHTAILGANGSGKSTLVQLIARELYPLEGARVSVFGLDRWNVFELRSLLGIVSPALQTDFAADSHGNQRIGAFEAVASGFFASRGLWHIHNLSEEMRRRSWEALEQMGVAHLAERDVATLSTGEARRVIIARALVHRPRALLLDEPCTGLDPGTRKHFLESLRAIARGGTTLLMVTHHVEEILPEIGEVVMLKHGRLLHHGAKDALLTSETLSHLFDSPLEIERRGDWYSAASY
jgi:iron complex transport system ATP-binding protein